MQQEKPEKTERKKEILIRKVYPYIKKQKQVNHINNKCA